jgi:hypothetical protein
MIAQKGATVKCIACISVFVILMMAGGVSMADPWKKSVDANLTMTQNAYSDNWIGGSAGSVAWVLSSNGLFEKQLGPRLNTRNTLKLFFGQTHSQDKDTKRWNKPVKSTDRIEAESVLRFTCGGLVDPYASGRVESEFFDQRDPSHGYFFNPALFTESFGVARVLAKREQLGWSARLGGAFRENLERFSPDPSGGTRRRTTTDGGILFVSDLNTAFSDSAVTITSRLSVYKAFYSSEAEKLEGQFNMDYWKTPDIDWESVFAVNIAKHLMVNLYVQFLYDKEVDLAGRFMQTLSLGITYKLM